MQTTAVPNDTHFKSPWKLLLLKLEDLLLKYVT